MGIFVLRTVIVSPEVFKIGPLNETVAYRASNAVEYVVTLFMVGFSVRSHVKRMGIDGFLTPGAGDRGDEGLLPDKFWAFWFHLR